MINIKNGRVVIYFFAVLMFGHITTVVAQDGTTKNANPLTDIQRIDKIVDSLDKKIDARDQLKKSVSAGDVLAANAQSELVELATDIQSLNETFELLTIGDMDDSLFKVGKDAPFDWRVELMLVVEPVLDSLQSLTEKPRQMTDLRANIALNKRRMEAAEQVIAKLKTLPREEYDTDTQARISLTELKWNDQLESSEQRLISAEAQLERLRRLDDSSDTGWWPSVREFILGRGLTLSLALIAAIVAWFAMRFLWWIFSTHVTSKKQRRESLWFRLLSYSYYLVNILACIVAVLAVFYVREDLLFLALALLLLTATALGIRRYVPGYVREARLLLNLGSVREGERVMYNDLPWQVNAINLQTVLWNPALEGIVRVPLEIVESMASRPIKDKNWFPSQKGDFILLTDGTLAEVLVQTPELVQLRIKGGMIQSFRASDYYAMSIINLSAGKSFGVSVTFGFDYNLQAISLTKIPSTLNESIKKALNDAGYKDSIDSLLVELQSASASSIDYLVFASFNSKKASDYFRIERLIQQTCVAVANENDWNIPFPQMMVHYQPATHQSPPMPEKV